MPHLSHHLSLTGKQQLLASLGMQYMPRPEWLKDAIAIESALNRDEKVIDKLEHLHRSQFQRDAIRSSKSYQRKLCKLALTDIAYRAAHWGVVELRQLPAAEGAEDGPCERIALHFRPRALAREPLLLDDLKYRDQFWAADIVFTAWLEDVLLPYSGPGELIMSEGESFLDAAALKIDGPSGQVDWAAVGKALKVIATPKFDAAANAVIQKIRRVHHLARH